MTRSFNRTTSTQSRTVAAHCLMMALGALLAAEGCSSKTSSSLIQVSPIVFTDANGNELGGTNTTMTAGSTVYVDAALTNDKALLGVDWTVDCGSAPPPGTPLPPGVTENDSCGTFTPVHTASAPVPLYASSGAGVVTLFTAPPSPPKNGVVTLYAAATGDHSRYSTVTLTIVGLPISIQFGTTPPSSMPVNGATSLKAVLTNDYVSGGSSWSVTCGATACGSFTSTTTASGVATTYHAPAAVPPGGTVAITATSVTDPTKQISAVIAIQPVAVTVTAASSTVTTGQTDSIEAAVANDVSSSGVDWTLNCGTPGACGSITSHTASGVAATYTAPDAVPGTHGLVTVQAASTANPAASGSVSLTIQASQASVRGRVMAGTHAVRGASISLYAVGMQGYGSASALLSPLDGGDIATDDAGNFSIADAETCPSASTQLYVVARGGNAGGGENPDITFMTPLGSCSQLGSIHGITANEVSTVVSAYALAPFMRDATHIGTASSNPAGLENADALVHRLVDADSGMARTTAFGDGGDVPETKINTLANVLNRCALTAGGTLADGSECSNLFAMTGGRATKSTLDAALYIAHHGNDPVLTESLYRAAGEDGPFAPASQASPTDWTLALAFLYGEQTEPVLAFDASGCVRIANQLAGSASRTAGNTMVDCSGNRWSIDTARHSIIENIGDAALEMRLPSRTDQKQLSEE
jgi:hypothetical protein